MIIKCKFDFSVVAMGERDPGPDRVPGKLRYNFLFITHFMTGYLHILGAMLGSVEPITW